MHDADVRSVLRASLHALHALDPGPSRIVEEFDLAGDARIDIAVLNGSMVGYEIKSERDTLRRLGKQVEVYSCFFDKVIIVAAPKHIPIIQGATPAWWSIVGVYGAIGSLQLKEERLGSTNPSVDPFRLCQLLWRDELLAELGSRQLLRGIRQKPRLVLAERLASNLPLDEVRTLVRDQLRARQSWRVAR